MAVIPTGAIFKSLIFDGEDSRNYGAYITGEAVYNAPARDVEMVSIPGRNGSFALDKGHFENIEVRYPAGIFADNETDFSEAISDFRNFLCSRSGYVRLTDEYNPGEYRMAIYKSGLEVKPAQLMAGEFDLVFDCKPQRWLLSGETKRSITSGTSITNPTLFPASPLIECKGQGTIYIGGVPIVVKSVPIGDILLANQSTVTITNAELETNPPVEILKKVIDVSNLNTGDAINIAESSVKYDLKYSIWPGDHFSLAVIEGESGEAWETKAGIISESSIYFMTKIPPLTFTKGTAGTKSYHYEARWRMTSAGGGSYVESSLNHYIKVVYDGNKTIRLYASTENSEYRETYTQVGTLGQINGYSTFIADNIFFIDLEIGEAYFNSGNVYTSANYAVQIPPKLPTLRPGASTITYSNTITNFKLTPRWWKI